MFQVADAAKTIEPTISWSSWDDVLYRVTSRIGLESKSSRSSSRVTRSRKSFWFMVVAFVASITRFKRLRRRSFVTCWQSFFCCCWPSQNFSLLPLTSWIGHTGACILLVRLPVWPDLAKFRHFGKNVKVFGNFSKVYLVFSKLLKLLCQSLNGIGQIFIVVSGQIFK